MLPGPERLSASEPQLGDEGRDLRGAISTDGSRVFFSGGGEGGPLYMRDSTAEQTIQINAAAPGRANPQKKSAPNTSTKSTSSSPRPTARACSSPTPGRSRTTHSSNRSLKK